MKSKLLILVLVFIAVITAATNVSYAQIDSRNQTRPDREQNSSDADKKKKKDKKRREKNKRLKNKKNKKNRQGEGSSVSGSSRSSGKKDPRTTGKKIYSNKKQIKRNSQTRSRAKEVDRGFKGDIAGRKQTRPQNRNRESSRSYQQPDPYKYRRIRTEKSRAGPAAPQVRSASRRGENARTGDISGQKTVRQKSRKSIQSSVYPQRNPYKGRTVKTEKQRAKSNKRQVQSVRSITRPAESRPPKARTKSRSGSFSASAQPKVKRKRNVYRNHERTGGEKSTSKDIAGKNLRTRNTRSAVASAPVPYSSINPYTKGKRYGEGQRYKRSAKRYSSARSVSRSSESAANRRSSGSYGQHRNRRTMRVSGVASAKSIRSTSDPNRKGERAIYGGKYSPPPPRSASRSGESKGPKRPKGYLSASGRRKSYKQRNTYQGKDRHFGENSTNRDIAGKKLRTRNKRSFHPSWSDFGGRTFGTGSVSGKPDKKYSSASNRRKSRANWNNSGNPIIGRGAGPRGESTYTGRVPLSSMPSYGPGREGAYRGSMPLSAIPGYSGGGGSTYRGKIKAKNLKKYRGGNESLYSGNKKSGKRLIGGGSITGFWNNKGNPLPGRGPGLQGESSYSGRMPMSALPSYGPGKEGTYQGKRRGYKPLKGGGSISGFWNNKGKALQKKDRSPVDLAISSYKGDLPFSALRSYGSGGEGSYAGNIKAKKPLKGGGSITTQWNNKNQPIEGRGPGKYDVGRYTGNMPMSSLPSYGDGKEGTYQGNLKRKDTKIGQSSGTERGRTKSFTFLRIGDVQHMGLNHHEKHLKVKNDLPKELSRVERQRIEDSEGMDRGRTKSLSFLNLGNPSQGGLHAELGNKKRKNDLPSEIKGKNRLRIQDSDGMNRGRTRSFTFLKIGDPNHGGLHAEMGNRKRKNDLPSSVKGKSKIRLADAEGMDNGRTRTLSFWAFGDPTKGGLVRSPAQAKGRLHPSSDYSKSSKDYNSVDKKEQPVKIKIWFAKLFKKNANQPDAVKEKERKPRYNKSEREIWETTAREDWYKN